MLPDGTNIKDATDYLRTLKGDEYVFSSYKVKGVDLVLHLITSSNKIFKQRDADIHLRAFKSVSEARLYPDPYSGPYTRYEPVTLDDWHPEGTVTGLSFAPGTAAFVTEQKIGPGTSSFGIWSIECEQMEIRQRLAWGRGLSLAVLSAVMLPLTILIGLVVLSPFIMGYVWLVRRVGEHAFNTGLLVFFVGGFVVLGLMRWLEIPRSVYRKGNRQRT